MHRVLFLDRINAGKLYIRLGSLPWQGKQLVNSEYMVSHLCAKALEGIYTEKNKDKKEMHFEAFFHIMMTGLSHIHLPHKSLVFKALRRYLSIDDERKSRNSVLEGVVVTIYHENIEGRKLQGTAFADFVNQVAEVSFIERKMMIYLFSTDEKIFICLAKIPPQW